jgi:hypothetical protein
LTLRPNTMPYGMSQDNALAESKHSTTMLLYSLLLLNFLKLQHT